MILTYPIEYGNILTPHPEIIYDIVPPIAVNEIKTEDMPIALINEIEKALLELESGICHHQFQADLMKTPLKHLLILWTVG